MITIKKHLELEKAKNNPSLLRIEEINKILNRGTITLEEWRMTGRFITKEEYKETNPQAKLKRNCKEIVEYVGDIAIQVLSTGDFVFEDTKDKDLELVENKIWGQVVEKLWCETC